MFLHKAIDLTDWEAASFAVLQSHGNQTAEKNHQTKFFIQEYVEEEKDTQDSWGDLSGILFHLHK